jgi:DNA/RNA-binding domain of Phe-tRNA-synthetase-like protein
MPAPYAVTVDREVAARVLPVVVWADGIVAPESSSRLTLLDELLSRAGRGEGLVSEDVRGQVRSMLRHGSYKPTGRGKPASEFLLQAALRCEFPRVNGPVDANNAISLASGFPGSIFDADHTGSRLFLRYGRPGESYVFNPSGQSIDLEDLVVVCREVGGRWEPCGNPVKDCMATKIQPETQNVVAILYVPRPFGDETALGWAARFADALAVSCSARDAGFRVVQEGSAG